MPSREIEDFIAARMICLRWTERLPDWGVAAGMLYNASRTDSANLRAVVSTATDDPRAPGAHRTIEPNCVTTRWNDS